MEGKDLKKKKADNIVGNVGHRLGRSGEKKEGFQTEERLE